MMSANYDVYSKFDLMKHIQTYVNYLEVVILEDGTVEYAVPSHQEKLIHIACEKLKCSRKELIDMCPPEYYGDFIVWLCQLTKAVSVWTDYIQYDTFNMKQVTILDALKIAGAYRGPLLG